LQFKEKYGEHCIDFVTVLLDSILIVEELSVKRSRRQDLMELVNVLESIKEKTLKCIQMMELLRH
jgi:hypothetical protein